MQQLLLLDRRPALSGAVLGLACAAVVLALGAGSAAPLACAIALITVVAGVVVGPHAVLAYALVMGGIDLNLFLDQKIFWELGDGGAQVELLNGVRCGAIALAAFLLVPPVQTRNGLRSGAWVFGLLIVWMAVGLLYSSNTGAGMRRLMQLVYPLALFLLTYRCVHERKDIDGWVHVLLIAGALCAGISMLMPLVGTGYRFLKLEGEKFRLSGTLLGPPSLSYAMLVPAVVAFSLSIRKRQAKLGILFGSLFGWFAGILLLTQTRTSLAALVVAVAWLLLRLKKFTHLLAISMFVLVVLAILPAEMTRIPRSMPKFDASPHTILSEPKEMGTFYGRLVIWRWGISEFVRHPFVGGGTGCLADIFSAGTYGQEKTGAGAMHCEYLAFADENGLIGLALFLAAYYALWPRIGRWTQPSDDSRSIVLAAQCAMVAFAVVCLTDNILMNYFQFLGPVFVLQALALRSRELDVSCR